MPDPDDDALARRWRHLLGLVLLLRCLAALWWPLSGDEAYHWEWARRPDLGYFDHPPLHAWTVALTTAILGHTEVAVRLPSILANLGMALVLATLVRRLAGSLLGPAARERAAAWTALLATFTPIHAAVGVYATGDALVSLCWSAFVLAAWSAVNDGRLRSWCLAGLALGFGILAKFLIVLAPFTLAVVCLLLPAYRRWLWSWKPWVCAVIALAVASPLLWWNAHHDWATFVFNFSSRHHIDRDWWREVPLYLGSQMAAVTPLLWLAGVGGAVAAFRPGRAPALRFLAAFILVPLGVFLINAFSKRVGLHWPAIAYPALYALVPLGAELLAIGRRQRRILYGVPLGLGAFLLVVASVPPTVSVLPFMPTDRDRPPRVGEVLGWEEVGALVSQRQADHQRGDRPVFLVAAQYGFVADLAFYVPGNPPIQHWDAPGHHGQQYLRFWNDFAAHQGEDALFVTRKESRVGDALPHLRKHFAEVGEVEAWDIRVEGKLVNRIWIVPCRGFDGVGMSTAE